MKKNYVSTLMVLSLAASLLSACNTSEKVDNDISSVEDSASTETTVSSEFSESSENTEVLTDYYKDTSNLLNRTISLVDNVSKDKKDKNIMISGLSVDYAMSMLINGTNNECTAELESFLGMNKEEANKTYGNLLNSYKNSNDSNKLIISNSFWINKDTSEDGIKKEYKQTIKDVYKAGIELISMNQKGVDKIDNWVSDSTEGFMKKALSIEDIVEADSILMNTIYFDGKWEYPFDASLTREEDFTLFDGSTQKVKMMNSQEYYFLENDKATAFAKNYKDGRYQFIGILPKDSGEFDVSSLNIEELLKTKKNINELNADLYVKLPKIDFEEKFELSSILQAMGVKEVFDDSKNNLTGIYKDMGSEQVSYIDEVLHNVKLKVDEEGTKAAAVTSIISKNTCTAITEPKRIIEVNLNRPFVAIIMDTETDTPLFIAKITNFN